MVSPDTADAGSGIVNWLTRVIHLIWDSLDVDWDKVVPVVPMEGEDEDYFPTGGCCGF